VARERRAQPFYVAWARVSSWGSVRRGALPFGCDARARQLGAPSFSIATRDIATASLNLGGALAVERPIDASSVPESLFGDAVALVYEGLVAQALRDAWPAGRAR